MLLKIFKCAGIGFLLGVVMENIIMIISGYAATGTVLCFSPEFLSRAGNELNAAVLQLLLSGIYGAICMGSTVIYDIEKIPLLSATVLHCIAVMLSYIPLSLYLCWITTAAEMMAVISIMLAVYFVVWLIMYCVYKMQTKELNKYAAKKRLQKNQSIT